MHHKLINSIYSTVDVSSKSCQNWHTINLTDYYIQIIWCSRKKLSVVLNIKMFILSLNITLFSKIFTKTLTLFKMDIFGAAHESGRGGGWQKGPPLPKICHTYPTKMKPGTVIPYLKKIQKIYESRYTPVDFC